MTRHSTLILALVLGLVGGPAFSGCLGAGAAQELGVVASSPRQGGGLTLGVMKAGLIGKGPSGQADFEIRYDGTRVYPPLPFGASFQVENGRGIEFVPYNVFVVGNGKYEVVVRFNGEESSITTNVEKWVEYVYLHPYDRGSKVVVDLQLSTSRGGAPTDRVIAVGDLRIDIRYRGADGNSDEYITSIRTSTPEDETFTRIDVPKGRFTRPGYYSFDAVFHNNQAKGNTWVGNDPSLADRNPPWNWVYVGP